VTPPKPAAARDAASQDVPSAAPLPFAPAKANQPTAQQATAHDVVPLTPAAHQPAAAQAVQFSPARPAPGPGPHPVPPAPAAPPPASAPAAPSIVVKPRRSGATRTVVLFVIPLIALALGFVWWLHSGRYVTTDNAYVGSDKVLITPQVSGAIVAVHVVEGQKVKVGDPLFDIDPQPYQIALSLAQGRLDAAKVEFANLRSSYVSNRDQIKMGEDAVTVRQADFDRKNALATHGTGTTADRDTSMAALIQARQLLEFVNQQQATTMVKLGGSLDAPIENFPAYIQARAGLEDAQRNLRNTKILAPIAGVATQVAQIELGRVAPAGQPVFAVVADTGLWVDANPKESDMTFVREGMPATVTIDAFPDKVWSGTICSIAPGTGAQFAILPPQNASGNWVKVVQRVPLRFCFGPNEDTTNVRSGMSANLSIDTGRVRTLTGVLSDLKSWAAGFVPGFAAAKNVPA
jgi:membrane fusion protein (multidrug efflux system)